MLVLRFTGWSGSVNGTSSTVSLTMNADRAVTATFTLKTYTITARRDNGSSLLREPSRWNYGANQSFTIAPNACYEVADVKMMEFQWEQ